MYIPKAFQVSDSGVLAEFIASNSFATLISSVQGSLFATHLPLILEQYRSSPGMLLGHVARANRHWQAFDGQQEALAIFHGPHAYISPSWYAASSPAVPTWNYAVMHVYGVPRIVDDEQWLSDFVDRLVTIYEADKPQPWPGILPPDLRASLLTSIVGFTMDITRVEGKFKLGQNRSLDDQRAMVQHLEAQADPVAQVLGKLTKQRFNQHAQTG